MPALVDVALSLSCESEAISIVLNSDELFATAQKENEDRSRSK
jgi:hypothetical protein